MMQKGIVKGNVCLGPNVSVWYNAVIRGDSDTIEIDEGTNVQEGCVIHVDAGFPVHIGKRVTIGHGAILHGCTIEDEVLIGMGSIIMNGACVGTHSIIGAGALIPENTKIPANSVVVGNPGKIIKQTTDKQVKMIIDTAKQYIEEAKREND